MMEGFKLTAQRSVILTKYEEKKRATNSKPVALLQKNRTGAVFQ